MIISFVIIIIHTTILKLIIMLTIMIMLTIFLVIIILVMVSHNNDNKNTICDKKKNAVNTHSCNHDCNHHNTNKNNVMMITSDWKRMTSSVVLRKLFQTSTVSTPPDRPPLNPSWK